MGMSLQGFDLLFAEVKTAHPKAEGETISKRLSRRAIGTARRFALDLRGRVMLLLFYYRTYATQNVAAEVFGVGQATVSRSIDQIAPVVRQCIQIPAKIHTEQRRPRLLRILRRFFQASGASLTPPSSRCRGPSGRTWKSPRYSGKAGRHTAKVQYAVNANGLIVHNTRHSPGRVHDVRVYRMKHHTFPSDLPSREGSDGKGEKARVQVYVDMSYPGAQKMYEEVEVLTPIRQKPGKNSRTQKRHPTRRTPGSASTWSTPSEKSRRGG